MSDEPDWKYLSDELRQMIAKDGDKFVTFRMFADALNFAKEMDARNAERNARLTVHDTRLRALEAKVLELEQRPALKYVGVHERGAHYPEGRLVTRSGSLWLSTTETDETPGEGSTAWRPIVKRGEV